MKPRGDQPSLFGVVALTSLFAWAAWKSWARHIGFPFLPALMAFVALAGVFKAISLSMWRVYNYLLRREAMRETGLKGTASWATADELKANNLYQTDGLFLGCDLAGKPIFFEGETHGLTLAPAGSGKTVAFTLPALCHSPLPIIAIDYKGVLSVMTKDLREKEHKQETFCVNPEGIYQDKLGTPARYNPMWIALDDWMDTDRNKDLMADVQAMALQLYPEPVTKGENSFFRNGSRKILVFASVFLITRYGAEKATLSDVLGLMRQVDQLIEACRMTKSSSLLNGELGDMAAELHYKLTAPDTRQVDSFLEGSIQSCLSFAPSGYLAESTSTCDFRFRDLKKTPGTVYLTADPTKGPVYAPWLGLMGWAAITELTRCRSVSPVLILLDEATNFKIEGLSHSLTGLREFGVRVWFVIQELEEYARVYGRESLETLLSQTEVKQIFGVQNQKTTELVSRMLGEHTVKSANYNLGTTVDDPVTQSVNEQARRLLTPDEVRRFTDTILFIRNLPPIHALKTGYHQVKPWSDWVAANPLFGSKLKGKTRVWLKY